MLTINKLLIFYDDNKIVVVVAVVVVVVVFVVDPHIESVCVLPSNSIIWHKQNVPVYLCP